MKNYPFTAIFRQDEMKEALILNLINPKLGGVLIRGQKGTAKSTAVRALADIEENIRVGKKEQRKKKSSKLQKRQRFTILLLACRKAMQRILEKTAVSYPADKDSEFPSRGLF